QGRSRKHPCRISRQKASELHSREGSTTSARRITGSPEPEGRLQERVAAPCGNEARGSPSFPRVKGSRSRPPRASSPPGRAASRPEANWRPRTRGRAACRSESTSIPIAILILTPELDKLAQAPWTLVSLDRAPAWLAAFDRRRIGISIG